MIGNPIVTAALQESINLEANMCNVYCINGIALKHRLGIKVGKELKGLGKQSKCFKKMLIGHLLFLDGKPEIDADIAVIGDDIPAMLNEMLAREMALVTKYTEFTKTCYDVNDMENFHLFQHLIRWHRAGHGQYEGHIAYLEHELKQLAALGLVDYIASHL